MEYIFTFLEGFASFISPCVLPLLPLYISYFAGKDNKRNKAFVNSIAFVLGFTIIFTIMAILANRAGLALVRFADYVKIIFGIVVIILGLNYIGIFNLKIFDRFKRFSASVESLNFFKSMIFGVMFSISMTPCVGTFLSSALLLVASKENMVTGILLILVYCAGLGVPFIISSLLIDKLKSVFDFIKKNYNIVKIISGAVLIAMGIYLIFF